MHKDHSKTQSHVCLICFEPLLKTISLSHLIKHIPICPHCIDQLQIVDCRTTFHQYPMRILYFYNEFFQSLLFQYKGLYDYALKDAFLCLFLDELKRKYQDYIIVVAPSSKEDNQKRGFAPMETIAYTLSQNVFNGLYKKEKYKQSDLRFEERKSVKEKISIKDGEKLRGKKLLIIDDVITSGQTLFTCLSLALMYQPQKIEFLILSSRQDKYIS